MQVGEPEHANVRTIRKYVHADGIASCEIAMGITTLEPGSVWNTMPCHTHDRRTEVYLYFDLPETERVLHLCGEPQSHPQPRARRPPGGDQPPVVDPLRRRDRSYKFVWSTAGENLA